MAEDTSERDQTRRDDAEARRGADGPSVPESDASGASDKGEDEDEDDTPPAPEPNSTRIRPGEIGLENAFFVVVGILSVILTIGWFVF